MVSSSPVDGEFTVNNIDKLPATNENTVNVQRLERCLTDIIDSWIKLLKQVNRGSKALL